MLRLIPMIVLGSILLLFAVRFAGRMYYNRTPAGGINETVYLDVNEQQQWLNIYGENTDNPVMLYLHGGPGNATSFGDWVILRKLAKDYTVVTWDQRDSGLTRIHDSQDTEITPELMRSDIDTVADYVCKRMGKEKLTIMGMSWGTIYGGDFVLRHPEKVDCFIALSLADQKVRTEAVLTALREYDCGEKDFRAMIDAYGYNVFFLSIYDIPDIPELIQAQNEGAKLCFLEWTENDAKYHQLAEQIDTTLIVKWYRNQDDQETANKIMDNFLKYEKPILEHYPDKVTGSETFSDTDVNLVKAIFFNPYYSLGDWIRFRYNSPKYDSDTANALFDGCALYDRTEYEVPVYVLEGSRDENDITGCQKAYFDSIAAPDKAFRYISGTHMSTMLHSEELAAFVHEIRTEKQEG